MEKKVKIVLYPYDVKAITYNRDDVPIVYQNIDLDCQSDKADVIKATAEIDNTGNYLCNLRYIGRNQVSENVGITVKISGYNVNRGRKDLLYSIKAEKFNVRVIKSNLYDQRTTFDEEPVEVISSQQD